MRNTTLDSGKVKLGGLSPSLATADTGKVRLGGLAPSLPATSPKGVTKG